MENRYHRQMLLPEIGIDGQKKLRNSKVLIAGVGALGCHAAELLVRMGVGSVVLIDRDIVELTNIHRQFLFTEKHASDSVPKAHAAADVLRDHNSEVDVIAINDEINAEVVEKYLASGEFQNIDLVIDGLDNFQTRMVLNDFCVKYTIPFLYASAIGMQGMSASMLPPTQDQSSPWEKSGLTSQCLACFFQEIPSAGLSPTCNVAGVLAPVISIVVGFQIAEAVKILTGSWNQISGDVLHLDLWENQLGRMRVMSPDIENCECCGARRFLYLENRKGMQSSTICGRNAIQTQYAQIVNTDVEFESLTAALSRKFDVVKTKFHLKFEVVDRENDFEIVMFPNGRAIVRGTTDAVEARRILDIYVGR